MHSEDDDPLIVAEVPAGANNSIGVTNRLDDRRVLTRDHRFLDTQIDCL